MKTLNVMTLVTESNPEDERKRESAGTKESLNYLQDSGENPSARLFNDYLSRAEVLLTQCCLSYLLLIYTCME
jgi:hypothetical protein